MVSFSSNVSSEFSSARRLIAVSYPGTSKVMRTMNMGRFLVNAKDHGKAFPGCSARFANLFPHLQIVRARSKVLTAEP